MEIIAAVIVGAILVWLARRPEQTPTRLPHLGVDTRSFGGACVYTHPHFDDLLVVEVEKTQYCLSAHLVSRGEATRIDAPRVSDPYADSWGGAYVHVDGSKRDRLPVGWERGNSRARQRYLKEVKELL